MQSYSHTIMPNFYVLRSSQNNNISLLLGKSDIFKTPNLALGVCAFDELQE
jgi:hypothetical protein